VKETLPHEKQIREYEETIDRLKGDEKLLDDAEVGQLESKLEALKSKVYSELTPVERLAICRHPQRPKSLDYIEAICTDFVELHGDRAVGDDAAVVGGFALIGEQKFVVVAQEKGADTDSRLKRNFGMAHPEGFRKALRLMEMAGRLGLPVLSLIDTPGAYPGLTAEERGQAWAIAENLRDIMLIPTPIIVGIIGEAGSGGALGMAIGDLVGMMEHSYYSVISPEGCASILWKDAAKKGEAAAMLKLNSENMLEHQIVDQVLQEPLGGAHHDPAFSAEQLRRFVCAGLEELQGLSKEELLERRYQKFRTLGHWEE
jgi:acetyl-CoA carboxylase carboxyl transferase subunit alpha